ncbi:SRPBCC family protein [Chitinophaga lutea]
MQNVPKAASPAANDVFITRTVNFPRELVFRIWTDPQHLPQWFAPNGCSIHFEQLDIRPGGRFHSCVHTPDGKDCWCVGEYLEIVSPEKIVYDIAIADEAGNRRTSAQAGMDPEWPDETLVTITFHAPDTGRTEITIHQAAPADIARRTGAYPSWLQMLDRMEAALRD